MHLNRRKLIKTAGTTALGGLAVAGGLNLRHPGSPYTAYGQGPDQFQKVGQANVHIAMGEFYFQVVEVEDGEIANRQGKNELIELPSAQELLIRFFNEGNAIHEAHFGRNPDPETLKSYQENLFGGGPVGSGFIGVHLEPGQESMLHLWLPKSSQGEWEMGCFIPGHYKAGMAAPLRVT